MPPSGEVVVVVSPIGPTDEIVEVVLTEASVVAVIGGVVEGETPVVVEVVFVNRVEVVFVNRVVVVTTVEPVVGTVVVVVTGVVVEVVIASASTLNKAVAQVCDPGMQATIWCPPASASEGTVTLVEKVPPTPD